MDIGLIDSSDDSDGADPYDFDAFVEFEEAAATSGRGKDATAKTNGRVSKYGGDDAEINGGGSAGKRRRVTFASQEDLVVYEPESATPEEAVVSDLEGADLEFCDEIHFAVDGTKPELSAGIRARSGKRLASLSGSRASQKMILEHRLRPTLIDAAGVLAAVRDLPSDPSTSAAVQSGAALVLFNVGCGSSEAFSFSQHEMPPVFSALSALLEAWRRGDTIDGGDEPIENMNRLLAPFSKATASALGLPSLARARRALCPCSSPSPSSSV